MSKKRYTVRDLASSLLHQIEEGGGDKIVKVGVVYDDCEHVQYLKHAYNFDGLNWIILSGGTDE